MQERKNKQGNWVNTFIGTVAMLVMLFFLIMAISQQKAIDICQSKGYELYSFHGIFPNEKHVYCNLDKPIIYVTADKIKEVKE